MINNFSNIKYMYFIINRRKKSFFFTYSLSKVSWPPLVVPLVVGGVVEWAKEFIEFADIGGSSLKTLLVS